ncbi:MAG: spermidine synthase [Mycobacteriales bacterium]
MTLELIRDLDRPRAYLLKVDGVSQSYVDLDNPTHLEFEYMRLLGATADLAAPAGAALDTVHVGGGACTLARYVASTRPGSRQLVYEPDEQLLAMVRAQLGLRRLRGVRVRVLDGAVGLPRLRPGSRDLVVTDAFVGWSMPAELSTLAFIGAVARVLRPAGIYAANVADGRGLAFTRAAVATLRVHFAHVALLAEPGVLRGRRFGNLVLLGSHRPLPLAALARRAAGSIPPARLVAATDAANFAGTASPITSVRLVPPPPPPSGLLER